jgi:tetratricopeptide (TPR) repeat protein
VAAFFALHPLRVESVAWISERKDVLCAFFFLLTIWAYHRYVLSLNSQRSTINYSLALIFCALALLSKPMAVTLPFVLLLLDFWPLRRFRLSTLQHSATPPLRLVLEKWPFFMLSVMDIYITAQVQREAMTGLNILPASTRVANMILAYKQYLAKTFGPVRLAVIYPYNLSLPVVEVVCALLLLVAASVLAWRWRHRLPWFITGWLWFLGTLVPTIGLVQVGVQAYADRYTYLPSIGLLVLVVWTVAAWATPGAAASSRLKPVCVAGANELTVGSDQAAASRRSGRWALCGLGLLAVAALVVLASLTRAQLSYWKTTETLMRHTVRVAGDNELSCRALGVLLVKEGKLEEAASQFRAGLKLDGDAVPSLLGFAAVCAAQNSLAEAERLYRKALALKPSGPVQFALADFLQDQGRLDEARVHYLQGLSLVPYQAKARNNLGNVYAKQANWLAAREQYDRALRLNPKSAEAHQNLGTLLSLQGSNAEALVHYSAAVKLQPSFAKAQNSLGSALALQGQLDEAIKHYQAALASKPDFAEAHFNLGEALARRGELAPAQAEFEAALNYQTNYANAHFGLAGVFAAEKQDTNVVRHLREAVRLDPGWLAPLNNLAWLLATHKDPRLRDGPEAVRLAQRAIAVAKTNDWERLDTFAAAQAEAGQFQEAVAAARKALALAVQTGQTNEASAVSNRLGLYQKGLPYREP